MLTRENSTHFDGVYVHIFFHSSNVTLVCHGENGVCAVLL